MTNEPADRYIENNPTSRSVQRRLAAQRDEAEGQERPQSIDDAFYQLTVAQRDKAWAEVATLRQQLDAIAEWWHLPAGTSVDEIITKCANMNVAWGEALFDRDALRQQIEEALDPKRIDSWREAALQRAERAEDERDRLRGQVEAMQKWGQEMQAEAGSAQRQLEEQLEAMTKERNQYIAEAKAYADDKYEVVAEMQNEIHTLERAIEGAVGNADAFEAQRDAALEQVKELKAQLGLTHTDWQIEMQRAVDALDDVGSLLDVVVWMSGSGDFGPDAIAGEGWAKYRDEVVKPAMQRWIDATDSKPGPLLKADSLSTGDGNG